MFPIPVLLLVSQPTDGLPPQARELLSKPFTEITAVDQLPSAVSSLLPNRSGLSNPGGPFTEGCVGSGPFARMIFAGSSSQLFLVGYETGGRSYNRGLVVYKLERGKARQIMSAPLPDSCSTLQAALRGIQNGSIRIRKS